MNTKTIRQKLHNYLEVAEDTKVKAIYEIMERDIEASSIEYTPELKNELNSRYKDYQNGKAKIVTKSESRKRLRNAIKSAGI